LQQFGQELGLPWFTKRPQTELFNRAWPKYITKRTDCPAWILASQGGDEWTILRFADRPTPLYDTGCCATLCALAQPNRFTHHTKGAIAWQAEVPPLP
jgi:hypothetical protein